MTTALANRMYQTVRRLLEKYGTDATLIGGVTVSADKVQGSVQRTEEPTPVFAAITSYDDKLVDGSVILKSDRKITMTSPVPPQIGGTVIILAEKWVIKDVKKLLLGSQPIVYILQVMK